MKCCNEDTLGRQLYMTGQDMRNFAEKVLNPYDLTVEQFHLLKNMPVDSGLTQREIGEITSKTPANMTRLLDRLEIKTLVERRDDPNDRRASLVFLTEKGKSLVDEVFNVFELFSADFLHGISEEEQQIVKNILTKITSNIKKMTEELEKKS